MREHRISDHGLGAFRTHTEGFGTMDDQGLQRFLDAALTLRERGIAQQQASAAAKLASQRQRIAARLAQGEDPAKIAREFRIDLDTVLSWREP